MLLYTLAGSGSSHTGTNSSSCGNYGRNNKSEGADGVCVTLAPAARARGVHTRHGTAVPIAGYDDVPDARQRTPTNADRCGHRRATQTSRAHTTGSPVSVFSSTGASARGGERTAAGSASDGRGDNGFNAWIWQSGCLVRLEPAGVDKLDERTEDTDAGQAEGRRHLSCFPHTSGSTNTKRGRPT